MVLHGILRNNWDTFIKVLVAAKLLSEIMHTKVYYMIIVITFLDYM